MGLRSGERCSTRWFDQPRMTLHSDALLRRWEKTLQHRDDDPAIFDTHGEALRTFAAIEQEAQDFRTHLLADVAPGQIVAIQVGNHPSWPALLLACVGRRVVALPLERSISVAERDTALAVVGAAAVISAGANGDIGMHRHHAETADWGEHQPVLLKLTSGTTAAPRAIRFRSEQLLADCDQICETMGISAADVNFAVIPVSHSYGFSNLITPLLARGVATALSSDRMPRAVLDDLARTKATVFPGMPVFYQAFCDLTAVPELPELRLCISAGAPLPLTVAQRFRAKFNRSIHSFYGSSECGGICYDRDAPLREEGFVGGAMQGVTLEILDEGDAATRIRVRSAAAGDGYFREPEPAKLGDGFFAPDDLLARRDDGFVVVGRTTDIINVAGKKVNPAEIEATLLSFEGVRAAAVFGVRSTLRNEEVAACIVASEAITEAALLEFCRHRLSGWQVPKRLFFVESIPVNERGKISRRALAERFTP